MDPNKGVLTTLRFFRKRIKIKKKNTCQILLINIKIIRVIRSVVLRNNFSKMFIHIYLLPLHVSALAGHPQTEYTISCWDH
jgi:hypothetical protein